MVSMYIGNKKVVLNLFPAAVFEGFSNTSVNDTANSAEVLFSLGADSRSEVDAMAKKAVDAGGILYGKPGEKDGWMYGCGLIDPDGHRWNVLFMDMSKMPGR
jgi:predicted lactoylglutathione lyase